MQILYSDRSIAVICKPVGLDSEHEIPAAIVDALGGACYPIHRLDRNVGGVMVYARTQQAAAILSLAAQENSIVKEYHALVHGVPPEEGILEDLLFKDSRKNKVFVVQRERKGVKRASLEFTRLQSANDRSLVHVRLHTGRTHQIRVQFASRGFPLLGDHKYGARDSYTTPALFSCRLSFPWNGKLLTFEAQPDWSEQYGI